MSTPLLEAREVDYRIGRRTLLDQISLTLPAGQVLALVGPNGAGKSTMLKLLAGDLTPSGGVVLLQGQPLDRYRPAELAHLRAVLPQSTLLTFPFTVLEVALMGRYPHLDRGGESFWQRLAARAALSRATVLELEQRRYPTLSGGEQQRVNLARAVAQETPILLLDEPTTHLDPRHQHTVLSLARELATAGAALLVVLHDLNLAATYADRIALLDQGRLVASGPPWEVLTADRLAATFGLPFSVSRHPNLDCPLVVPTLPAVAGDLVGLRRAEGRLW